MVVGYKCINMNGLKHPLFCLNKQVLNQALALFNQQNASGQPL